MFDELNKYNNQGNFFFEVTDSLAEVCNAPEAHYGIYLVYALRHGRIELIYIGKSGFEINISGHKGEPESIKECLISGYHFGEVERKNSWPVQMLIEDIEALHVHWYVTFDQCNQDKPNYMKNKLLEKYRGIYGHQPRWNKVI